MISESHVLSNLNVTSVQIQENDPVTLQKLIKGLNFNFVHYLSLTFRERIELGIVLTILGIVLTIYCLAPLFNNNLMIVQCTTTLLYKKLCGRFNCYI